MDDLGDEDWVSQYGTIHAPIGGNSFKCRPFIHEDPQELSLLAGKLTPDEAAGTVNRRRTSGALPGDGVRHASVGKLRSAGFRVWRSPTKKIAGHVSVMPLDGNRPWTDDDSQRFDACFESKAWKEGKL
ncbi:hypothetical protein [Streptosporangium sp. NPDC006007]|uniref:hypothetical protein n=1 Tax=Streptosporangium sp. NPDC006007 TaxID=3154575 RepID=UPI0033A9A650